MLPGLQLHICVRLEQLPDSEVALAPRKAARTGESAGAEPDKPLGSQFAVIPLGRVINRLVTLPVEKGYGFVLLEDLVKYHIDDFFLVARCSIAPLPHHTQRGCATARRCGAGPDDRHGRSFGKSSPISLRSIRD